MDVSWWSKYVVVDIDDIPLLVDDTTVDENDFSVLAVVSSIEINSSVALEIKVCVIAVVFICV